MGIKFEFRKPKRYEIRCYSSEFEKKFNKILRQNGIKLSEYKKLVNAYDELRDFCIKNNCDCGGYGIPFNSRYMMIAKILSRIILTYREKGCGEFIKTNGYILNYHFITTADGIEYWLPGDYAPYLSKFEELDREETKKAVQRILEEERNGSQ